MAFFYRCGFLHCGTCWKFKLSCFWNDNSSVIYWRSIVRFWFSGTEGMIATLGVAAIVCCAACTSGDVCNDLKTGQIVGASPFRQQITNYWCWSYPRNGTNYAVITREYT